MIRYTYKTEVFNCDKLGADILEVMTGDDRLEAQRVDSDGRPTEELCSQAVGSYHLNREWVPRWAGPFAYRRQFDAEFLEAFYRGLRKKVLETSLERGGLRELRRRMACTEAQEEPFGVTVTE
jgi:hypothetical protein